MVEAEPFIEWGRVYVLLKDDRSDRACVVRYQRHRAQKIISDCPTLEGAQAALRLMLLEEPHAD